MPFQLEVGFLRCQCGWVRNLTVWRAPYLLALILWLAVVFAHSVRGEVAADLAITNANVLTVDDHFSQAQAIAIRGEYIVAVGSNSAVVPLIGKGARVVDARGKMVLPGLCDSHTHTYRAAVSEFSGPLPVLKSLIDAFQFIRQKAANQPPGSWILLERVYPTRLKEGRLPT